MTIKFITKKMYSFAELEQRWECSLADLKQSVFEGEIVPSLYINAANFVELSFIQWGEHITPLPSPEGIGDDGYAKPNYIRGFKYLLSPFRKTAFDGDFSFFSDKAKGFCVGDVCHGFNENVTIDTVMKDGFVLAEEVARVEAAYNHREQEIAEKPLGTNERNGLLNIIGAMLDLLQTPRSGRDSDTAVITELVENYSDKHGISKSNLEGKFSAAKRSLRAN